MTYFNYELLALPSPPDTDPDMSALGGLADAVKEVESLALRIWLILLELELRQARVLTEDTGISITIPPRARHEPHGLLLACEWNVTPRAVLSLRSGPSGTGQSNDRPHHTTSSPAARDETSPLSGEERGKDHDSN